MVSATRLFVKASTVVISIILFFIFLVVSMGLI